MDTKAPPLIFETALRALGTVGKSPLFYRWRNQGLREVWLGWEPWAAKAKPRKFSLPDHPLPRPNFSSVDYSWAALPVLESRTCKTLSPFHDRGDGEQRHDLQEARWGSTSPFPLKKVPAYQLPPHLFLITIATILVVKSSGYRSRFWSKKGPEFICWLYHLQVVILRDLTSFGFLFFFSVRQEWKEAT